MNERFRIFYLFLSIYPSIYLSMLYFFLFITLGVACRKSYYYTEANNYIIISLILSYFLLHYSPFHSLFSPFRNFTPPPSFFPLSPSLSLPLSILLSSALPFLSSSISPSLTITLFPLSYFSLPPSLPLSISLSSPLLFLSSSISPSLVLSFLLSSLFTILGVASI